MQTRRCSSCREEKTIRGVWYMLPPARGSGAFVCETCMTRTATALA